MGAIVAATYGLNDDWYGAIRDVDLDNLPTPPTIDPEASGVQRARNVLSMGRMLRDLALHWGTAERAMRRARTVIGELTLGRNLEEARVPVAICATDLRSGERVVLRDGPAVDAAFASGALAGVVPPVRRGEWLLADGAYTDIAPVDVARAFGNPVVIAVDPGKPAETPDLHNGLQVLARAMEICHTQHAELRFAQADLALRPPFRRPIETLDFGARREAMAAGMRVVRVERDRLAHLLQGDDHGESFIRVPPSLHAHPAIFPQTFERTDDREQIVADH
jgi:NTE family protein